MPRRRTDHRSGVAPREMSRPAVRKLAPYVPGKTIEEVRRTLGLEHVIKLASNENPLGSSPKAMAALRQIDKLHLYLDDAYPELRERIASPYGLRAQNVVLGHGSNELVNIACETLLESGDEAVMGTPSFSLYKLSTALQGAAPVEVPLREGVHRSRRDARGRERSHEADVRLRSEQSDGNGARAAAMAIVRFQTARARDADRGSSVSRIHGFGHVRCGRFGSGAPEHAGSGALCRKFTGWRRCDSDTASPTRKRSAG